MINIKQIIISSIILLALDFIFIYLISRTFSSQIFVVQHSPLHVNILGAILCYGFLIFGLNYFILKKRRSVFEAFLLGIVIYGVYETTSLALLRNWRLSTVIIDTLWGGILFGLTTYLTYFATSY